jgi:hypothetical protein
MICGTTNSAFIEQKSIHPEEDQVVKRPIGSFTGRESGHGISRIHGI